MFVRYQQCTHSLNVGISLACLLTVYVNRVTEGKGSVDDQSTRLQDVLKEMEHKQKVNFIGNHTRLSAIFAIQVQLFHSCQCNCVIITY